MLNWLLIFVPVTIALEFLAPAFHTVIFVASCLAIVPLAGWLGHATGQLARHTGEGIGGLLNATFGNAAELIIAIAAIQKGIYPVVKASLTGSIIGNVLLVLGASVFAGGLKFKEQRFNVTAARAQSTLLTLAAIGFITPAAYHYLAGAGQLAREGALSLEISIVLLLAYAAHLVFSLVTHKQLFAGETAPEENGKAWGVAKSLIVLSGATALIAWVSEILVGSVEPAAASFGMTRVFIGVIVVAVVGNAAEHSTAVMMALKNRMELSLGIAIGSSLQIALFVAPLLVFLSLAFGRELTLVFNEFELAALAAAVVIGALISLDGESNWLEGAQLLIVYSILALAFFFLPA